MSRPRGFSVGPLMFRGSTTKKKTPAAAPAHGGYPDAATWGAAVMLGEKTLKAMAANARADAVGHRDEARVGSTRHEVPMCRVAELMLTEQLREVAEQDCQMALLAPLAAHLTHVGIAAVDWDAIARKALS